MKWPTSKDKTLNLAEHLIAAKLNVAIGNESSCIADTIANADDFLSAFPVGSGVSAYSTAWKTLGGELLSTLCAYNEGRLCALDREAAKRKCECEDKDDKWKKCKNDRKDCKHYWWDDCKHGKKDNCKHGRKGDCKYGCKDDRKDDCKHGRKDGCKHGCHDKKDNCKHDRKDDCKHGCKDNRKDGRRGY